MNMKLVGPVLRGEITLPNADPPDANIDSSGCPKNVVGSETPPLPSHHPPMSQPVHPVPDMPPLREQSSSVPRNISEVPCLVDDPVREEEITIGGAGGNTERDALGEAWIEQDAMLSYLGLLRDYQNQKRVRQQTPRQSPGQQQPAGLFSPADAATTATGAADDGADGVALREMSGCVHGMSGNRSASSAYSSSSAGSNDGSTVEGAMVDCEGRKLGADTKVAQEAAALQFNPGFGHAGGDRSGCRCWTREKSSQASASTSTDGRCAKRGLELREKRDSGTGGLEEKPIDVAEITEEDMLEAADALLSEGLLGEAMLDEALRDGEGMMGSDSGFDCCPWEEPFGASPL